MTLVTLKKLVYSFSRTADLQGCSQHCTGSYVPVAVQRVKLINTEQGHECPSLGDECYQRRACAVLNHSLSLPKTAKNLKTGLNGKVSNHSRLPNVVVSGDQRANSESTSVHDVQEELLHVPLVFSQTV